MVQKLRPAEVAQTLKHSPKDVFLMCMQDDYKAPRQSVSRVLVLPQALQIPAALWLRVRNTSMHTHVHVL